MPQSAYGISLAIDAPLTYVYDWCTDFTDDDPKITGAPYTRHVIEKTKKRVVWIQRYTIDGTVKEGVRIVTLSPPDSWHLESINEEVYRIGDYILSSSGRERTKLKIKIKARYKTNEPKSTLSLKQNLSEDWDKYKAALVKDYASRNPRKR